MAMGIMAEGEYQYGDDMDNGYDSEEEFIDNTQFEDPEGFVDPMLEEELVGDILERRPMESDSLDMVIIVDNVPTVGPDRLGKLKNVIRKVFSRFGTVVNEFYPEENGKNKGYIFLEFSTAEEAAHAIKAANGYKLDKSHTFVVNSFSDFEKYKNVTEEWVPPEKKEYNDTSKLSSWLLEGDGNDYYAVVHSNNELSTHVGILKNGNTAPTLVCKRESWTEKYIAWSPKGTYMATFHEQGIALWGGKDMERLHKFNHTDVMLIDFSPCEKYIVTYSRDPPQENQAIIIWEIKTGLKKRGFMAGGNGLWPVFKWNHDGNMVARAVGENLSVYSIPSFGLLDKKSLKIPGLVDFSWSPTKNIIVYWVPENKDTPARLVIMDLPSRTEIRVKNLFNVQDCKMFWQKSGDFLCVKVDRLTKSKKRVYYNLELFRVNEKNIPVDTLEIKETIIAFDWEPNGNIFCVIHGEAPCIVSSFYQLEERELGNVMLIKTFDKRPANTICWAPTGQFCVLAGLRNLNGTLDFIDTADMSLMNDDEHFMATDIEWDATGRYLMTGVSWWAHKVENAYFIWSFQGKKLQTHAIPQFCHFSWRPRPPSLMTADDVARVKKELKKYQKQFELEDRRSQSKASKELLEKRRRLHTEFSEFRARHQQQFEETKKMRLELRDGMNTDSLQSEFDEFEEETVEFFVQELVEIIQSQAE